jgi:uncharacterized protein (DUF849 family)
VNEAGTDMIGAAERVAHVAECLPEICTLDCGTMNFAEADYVMTNTPGMLRAMGRMMTDLGVKPEIEAFDTGHLWFAKELVKEGVLEAPALVQLCMGVPWGAPDDLNTFMAMVNNVPRTGPSRPFRWVATRWPMPPPPCWRAGMCALGWRTTSGSARACWRPTHSLWSAPRAWSRAWAHG